jgi:hypothetical protein
VGSTPYYYYGGTYHVLTTAPAQKPPSEAVSRATPQATSGGTGSAGTYGAGKTKEESSEEAPPMIERDDGKNYKVVKPPIGATVTYLPEEAKKETVKGKTYFNYEGTYYRPFSSEGETIYMVVENPA